jgi:hypothetical protein
LTRARRPRSTNAKCSTLNGTSEKARQFFPHTLAGYRVETYRFVTPHAVEAAILLMAIKAAEVSDHVPLIRSERPDEPRIRWAVDRHRGNAQSTRDVA